ncbi:peptidase S8 [Pseudoalteromonas sp. S1727]|uniref:S8 family serine peptidase n=1 Tax=Pseudoalteromonas sp. S1727 TaxID=2066514 RepID=UPI0011080358|nr:S8 family serine peptidase [Pseudoalteromonas sp. S1727]TMN72647.1 peptidase S8 [Pseudoalteromonas sp. S1727]
MFNKTKIAVVVTSALYAASAATASDVNNNNEQWAAPTSQTEIKAQPELNWPNKLNQQVKKQNTIFKAEKDITGTHTYIVQLEDAPITSYDGGIAGHTATKSLVQAARSSNRPLDLNQTALAQYQTYLQQQQTTVLNNAQKLQGLSVQSERSFTVALNGFTTRMTQEQAQQLAKVPGVKHIKRSELKQLQTFNTIEETGAHDVWAMPASGTGKNLGEGIVVGIIDTGINTDHPSFSAVGGDGYQHINPLGADNYLGDCQANASLCNSKLIGVYSYPEITSTYSDPVYEESRPENGEDYHSHGSHVAGTSAGNILYNQKYLLTEAVTQSNGIPTNLEFEQVSGMAPHANLISYQACFAGSAGDPYSGCPETAIISAIEQAAIDNVDVINFSIGGLEQDPWTDPIEQAFFNAAKSGIFIAAAAGNNGPEIMSADHSSPWLTTVAASTPSSRIAYADKSLTNMTGGDTAAPSDISGRSITFDELTGLVVNAADFDNPNETIKPWVANCDKEYPEGTFDFPDDPATPEIDESEQAVIVVCKRSSNPLYYKGVNVAKGGAEGLIIYNQSSFYDSAALPDVPHPIPAIHIKNTDAQDILTWLSTGDSHIATITPTAAEIEDVDGHNLAYFSSQGPSYFGLNTLFVDIAAPGVDIYAPGSTDQPFTANPGTAEWMMMSGTSMASPHVAGAAALLKQSHPDWSPLEIQSALLMTASNDLYSSKFLASFESSGYNSSMGESGAGRMHVDLADKVGLVLDESMENMKEANPNLGGFVENLNTAYMVNTDCVDECKWIRTFKATEDGSWAVTTDAFTDGFEIEVTPSEFTVKKGETVSLIVTAKTIRAPGITGQVDYIGNQGQLVLTPEKAESPKLELPVWTYNGDTGLPDFVTIEAHRTSGVETIGPMITGDITDFASKSYGFQKADIATKVLPKDSTENDPFDNLDEVLVTFSTVPENTPLIISQIIGDDTQRKLIFMGQDSNGDGIPSWDEILCMSTAYTVTNTCAIHDPEEGQYWTLVSNVYNSDPREVSVASAVLSTDAGNITVSAPEKVSGYQDYTIDVGYSIPEMEIGEIYFGGIDIGSNPSDIGNVGFIPLILSQIDEDVSFTASKNKAKVGDIVDFNVKVIANNTEHARNFALDLALPQGIELIAESVIASHSTPGEVLVNDQTWHVEGTQESTKDVDRNYKITTNITDEMCSLRVAGSPTPGYLDLRQYGWRTLVEVEGTYSNSFEFSLQELMNTEQDVSFPFFNLENYTSLKISPAGAIYWSSRRLPSAHTPFPTGSSIPTPEHMIAPYWVGDNTLTRFDALSGQYDLNAGVTPSYTSDREWLVLEWDNVERRNTDGQSVDFEVFLRTNINYEPGEYEMMFAYDNLSMADEKGSIGFKSYAGRTVINGSPVEHYYGDGIAFNDLTDVLNDELVVCMDYTGPEESQFNVAFQGYVTQAAAGQTTTIELKNGLEGAEQETLTVELEVAGNIELLPVADMETDAGQPVSFTVNYTDKNKVSNLIEIEGEHITYEVSGNETGSTVTITPDIGAVGELDLILHVRDSVATGDVASQPFVLSVNKVNTAPTVIVQAENSFLGEVVILDASRSTDTHDELSFSWTQVSGPSVTLSNSDQAIANFSATELGEYVFNVTVTDGTFTVAKELKLTVVEKEQPPVEIENTAPVIIAKGTNTTVGNFVTLDASQSKDAESDELTYNWEQTTGNTVTLANSNTAIATFNATQAGEYQFIVTVSDGELQSQQSVTVMVDEAVEPEEDKDSGSSSGLLLMLLAIPAVLRRKFNK